MSEKGISLWPKVAQICQKPSAHRRTFEIRRDSPNPKVKPIPQTNPDHPRPIRNPQPELFEPLANLCQPPNPGFGCPNSWMDVNIPSIWLFNLDYSARSRTSGRHIIQFQLQFFIHPPFQWRNMFISKRIPTFEIVEYLCALGTENGVIKWERNTIPILSHFHRKQNAKMLSIPFFGGKLD
jgi:hypothetical protein